MLWTRLLRKLEKPIVACNIASHRMQGEDNSFLFGS